MADIEDVVIRRRSNAILDALVVASITALAAVIWNQNTTLTRLETQMANASSKVSQEIYERDQRAITERFERLENQKRGR